MASFWALEVTPGKIYKTELGFDLHLRQAALGAAAKAGERVVISVHTEENKAFVLGSLRAEHCEQIPLDLHFCTGKHVGFSVAGSASVHLTGNTILNIASNEGDFDDSEEGGHSRSQPCTPKQVERKGAETAAGSPKQTAKPAAAGTPKQGKKEDDKHKAVTSQPNKAVKPAACARGALNYNPPVGPSVYREAYAQVASETISGLASCCPAKDGLVTRQFVQSFVEKVRAAGINRITSVGFHNGLFEFFLSEFIDVDGIERPGKVLHPLAEKIGFQHLTVNAGDSSVPSRSRLAHGQAYFFSWGLERVVRYYTEAASRKKGDTIILLGSLADHDSCVKITCTGWTVLHEENIVGGNHVYRIYCKL